MHDLGSNHPSYKGDFFSKRIFSGSYTPGEKKKILVGHMPPRSQVAPPLNLLVL